MQVLEELLCDDGDEQTHDANVDESPETKDGAMEDESSNDQQTHSQVHLQSTVVNEFTQTFIVSFTLYIITLLPFFIDMLQYDWL